MTLAWIYLFLAGFFEVGATTALRFTQGFTRAWPTAIFFACCALSFYCLGRSLSAIPLGVAYAVWVGVGAAGTAIAGKLAFGEDITHAQMAFIALLIVSVVGLKLGAEH